MTGRAAATCLAECSFPQQAERHQCRKSIRHHGAAKLRLPFQFLSGCRGAGPRKIEEEGETRLSRIHGARPANTPGGGAVSLADDLVI